MASRRDPRFQHRSLARLPRHSPEFIEGRRRVRLQAEHRNHHPTTVAGFARRREPSVNNGKNRDHGFAARSTLPAPHALYRCSPVAGAARRRRPGSNCRKIVFMLSRQIHASKTARLRACLAIALSSPKGDGGSGYTEKIQTRRTTTVAGATLRQPQDLATRRRRPGSNPEQTVIMLAELLSAISAPSAIKSSFSLFPPARRTVACGEGWFNILP